ncbi:MAG: hypothetical protein J6C93_04545 [Clostridia bacterium]|nr:hypothetical protein [Clostridia bacterium]
MATIEYKFSDGHIEEIEVTEEFKEAYEFELVLENLSTKGTGGNSYEPRLVIG